MVGLPKQDRSWDAWCLSWNILQNGKTRSILVVGLKLKYEIKTRWGSSVHLPSFTFLWNKSQGSYQECSWTRIIKQERSMIKKVWFRTFEEAPFDCKREVRTIKQNEGWGRLKETVSSKKMSEYMMQSYKESDYKRWGRGDQKMFQVISMQEKDQRSQLTQLTFILCQVHSSASTVCQPLAGKAHGSLTCTIPRGDWVSQLHWGAGKCRKPLRTWWRIATRAGFMVMCLSAHYYQVLWSHDCDEEKQKDAKLRYCKVFFHLAFLPGFYAASPWPVHGYPTCSARLLLCLKSDLNGTTRSKWGPQLYDSIGSAIHYVRRSCCRSLSYLCFSIFRLSTYKAVLVDVVSFFFTTFFVRVLFCCIVTLLFILFP